MNKIKKSCSIYSLLEDHNIITHKKVKELEANEKDMGSISELTIDIYNMNDNILHLWRFKMPIIIFYNF